MCVYICICLLDFSLSLSLSIMKSIAIDGSSSPEMQVPESVHFGDGGWCGLCRVTWCREGDVLTKPLCRVTCCRLTASSLAAMISQSMRSS